MSWLTWPFRLIGFTLWFAKELTVTSMVVLKDNLTPGQDSRPGIAAFDTRCRNDYEVTLLAALITLTPGTLTLGLNSDSRVTESSSRRGSTGSQAQSTADRGATRMKAGPRTLYVHGMYSDNADAMREELRDMETRMLRAVRRKGVPE